MFRRLPASLPDDASFPEDLDELGYVMTETSQLRQKGNQDQGFHYRITNNDRYNDMHREALRECLRKDISSKMHNLGYDTLYFPQITSAKPSDAHIPIFTTPLEDLKSKKHVIIVINDMQQDLGVWAWRLMTNPPNDSLEKGSCLGLARDLMDSALRTHDGQEPALVVLNPGQLAFSWKKNRALTTASWQCLPRSSLVHPPPVVDPEYNVVEGHADPDQHVASVLNYLLGDDAQVDKDAEVYMIAIDSGAGSLLKWLEVKMNELPRERLTAACFICPYWSPVETASPRLRSFLDDRCRIYDLHGAPLNTCIGAPYQQKQPDDQGYQMPPPVCLTFASGPIEGWFTQEMVFPHVKEEVLKWFNEVAEAMQKHESYANPVFEVQEPEVLPAEDNDRFDETFKADPILLEEQNTERESPVPSELREIQAIDEEITEKNSDIKDPEPDSPHQGEIRIPVDAKPSLYKEPSDDHPEHLVESNPDTSESEGRGLLAFREETEMHDQTVEQSVDGDSKAVEDATASTIGSENHPFNIEDVKDESSPDAKHDKSTLDAVRIAGFNVAKSLLIRAGLLSAGRGPSTTKNQRDEDDDASDQISNLSLS